MTRDEHIKWCKERAIQEFDYYAKNNLDEAVRNGLTSMMSDMNKHDETRNNSLSMLCIYEMQKKHTRDSFVKFINGFN